MIFRLLIICFLDDGCQSMRFIVELVYSGNYFYLTLCQSSLINLVFKKDLRDLTHSLVQLHKWRKYRTSKEAVESFHLFSEKPIPTDI